MELNHNGSARCVHCTTESASNASDVRCRLDAGLVQRVEDYLASNEEDRPLHIIASVVAVGALILALDPWLQKWEPWSGLVAAVLLLLAFSTYLGAARRRSNKRSGSPKSRQRR